MSFSLSIMPSDAIRRTVSLGSLRDRVEMRQCAFLSGLLLWLTSSFSNFLCVTEWVHIQVYDDKKHSQTLSVSDSFTTAVEIIPFTISCTYFLFFFIFEVSLQSHSLVHK